MSADKLTLAQEYQNLLYGLLQTHVMSLDGPAISNEEQIPVPHVSRDILVDKLLVVLNQFGEAMNSDERLKKCD
jgi:hypothetical protein